MIFSPFVRSLTQGAALAAALATAGASAADIDAVEAGGTEPADALVSPEPRIDARALEHMRAACEYLAGQPSFSVHAEATLEEIFRGGRRVQHSRGITVVLKRPDRMRAEIDADRGRRTFLYDGKSVTVADIDTGLFGRFDAPGTVDAMLDDAAERFNVVMPLADLVSDNPCAALKAAVQRGWYLGKRYLPGGRYHHMLFSAPEVDLQVWVSDGEAPVFRKLVLGYKNLPGTPQYGVMLTDWNFAPSIDAAEFEFSPPAGVVEIGFIAPAAAPVADAPAENAAGTPETEE